jgi:hypothetical protein
MRKVISLGLCALMFFLFSGQVLAGKNQDCEDQKDELKALGLYGLCNAYWNAGNENARSQILTNFEDKAGPGGPGMPGLEPDVPDVPEVVVCPCTDGFDTTNWGMVIACTTDGTGDMGMFVNPDLGNFTTRFMTIVESDVYACSISQSPNTFIEFIGITEGEYNVCLDQLLLLCSN